MTAPTGNTESGSAAGWWRRVGPGKRAVVVVVGAVVALNLGLSLLRSVTGGTEPGGPTSSAYATGRDGVAAWADLLRAQTRTVERRREPLASPSIDPRSTLVVADPDELTPDDAVAVADFVRRGGRLVAAGRAATDLTAVVLGHDPGWTEGGAERAQPVVPAMETAGVAEVRGAGLGAFALPGPALPILGGSGSVTAVVADVGRGVVVGVADSSVFHNERLAEADNAAFALGVTDGRPVVFAESVHGYGQQRGLSALPASWRWCGAGLLAVMLLGVWTYGQRFGPAEDAARRLPPPRRDYVDAMATSLARTRDGAAATAGLRAAGRRRLCDRTGLPATVADPALRDAAITSGVTPDDVDAILGPASGHTTELLAVGRAAAGLRSRAGDEHP